jgi:hypothetical protein
MNFVTRFKYGRVTGIKVYFDKKEAEPGSA